MKALVLHGFTGSLDTITRLRLPLESLGYEVSTPVLRGHGTRPDHLYGVNWRDWVADARRALLELTHEDDDVVVAGLSMGALVACQLAAEFPVRVRRLALLAPALGFRSPLIHAIGMIRAFRSTWPSTPNFADPTLSVHNSNYPWFPIEAFATLLDYIPVVKSLIPHICCPVGIFFADHDPTIAASVPQTIASLLKPQQATHFTYHRSHHELLLDVEADTITTDVITFLCAQAQPSSSDALRFK